MATVDFFQKLFTYNHWANQEVLSTLTANHNDQALRFLRHIIGAEQIWLARLHQEDTASILVWPTLSLAECSTCLDDLQHRWKTFLDALLPEKLTEKVIYHNTQGVRFETPLQDILMHVVMHSAYHRGQITSSIRGSGGTPTPTDYIVFVRNQG